MNFLNKRQSLSKYYNDSLEEYITGERLTEGLFLSVVSNPIEIKQASWYWNIGNDSNFRVYFREDKCVPNVIQRFFLKYFLDIRVRND